jgi:anhydro-N-acetylmuramic acid kinase
VRVIGLISGTSHDGIDAAAVDFRLEGETLHGTLLATECRPYEPRLRARLIEALPPAAAGLEEICRLDVEIGQAFARAALDVLELLPGAHADLVCSHGQTVFHGVEGGEAWGTLQVGQPAWIAEATGLPVVSDLRSRDITAGGQGAPLVPILDALVLAGEAAPVAALNLGGIANVTVLSRGEDPIAYDLGPANALIDAAMMHVTDGREAFDADGREAAGGAVDAALLAALLDEPYYRLPPPKTTGKELFHGAYLAERAGSVSGRDLVATATALTAEVVARAMRDHGVERVLVSGGGARNPTLMAWIAERLPGVEIAGTDAVGLPPDAKEAIAFALLGWLSAHGLPGSVASCTGASAARVLGSFTPGRDPLAARPAAAMPRRLVMEAAR